MNNKKNIRQKSVDELAQQFKESNLKEPSKKDFDKNLKKVVKSKDSKSNKK